MWTTRSAPSLKDGIPSLKDGILARLRQIGATRMEASYSGGNDEGGLDNVRVFRPAGKNEYVLYRVYERNLYGRGSGRAEVIGTEEVQDSFPCAGPYTTKRVALAEGRRLLTEAAPTSTSYQRLVRYEPVKVTGEVELFNAEVGDWDDRDSLYGLVDDLLSIDFGSWAGEFSAHGVVLADVAQRRVWREGEISTYTSDESGGEY